MTRFRHGRRWLSRGVILLLLAGLAIPAGAGAGHVQASAKASVKASAQAGTLSQAVALKRISVGLNGNAADGDSFAPSMSADGRYVAFASDATNLVPNDTNGARDIFVLDRDTDGDGVYDEPGFVKIVRVSVRSDGGQASAPIGGARAPDSDNPSISADGRFVAFESWASDLVPGDTNNTADIFVHDRDADGDGIFDEPGAIATWRVSVRSGGAQSNDSFGFSVQPAVSGNGRYVAFQSWSNDLVDGDTNGTADIFVHDLQTGMTERVSVADGSGAEANGMSERPSISYDGRFVAFASTAFNLAAGDTNRVRDVFVRDRALGKTERVSVSGPGAAEGDKASGAPSISADGRFVAFESAAANLVPGYTITATPQVYLRDRLTGVTYLASLSLASGEPGDGPSWGPVVAAGPDGSVAVAFTSQSANLADDDDLTFWDAFLARFLGATPEGGPLEPESIIRLGGTDGNTDDPQVQIDPGSGRMHVGVTSQAALADGDTNGKADVYVTAGGVTKDGGGTDDDGTDDDGTPASAPEPKPRVIYYNGTFEASQGVWQDDYSFADKPGKRLVIDDDQHTITAELPMVLHRPTLLFGTRGSATAANDPGRNTITITGAADGTVAVPVKFKFTVKQHGIENLIYISPTAGQIDLDGQPGPVKPFSVSLDVSKGIPPDKSFIFLMTGPYTIEMELIREDGTPTGIVITLEGEVVETRGPKVYFQPILVPGDPGPDSALADYMSGRAADLAAESAKYVPDMLPLKPGGLPVYPRGTRDMRKAIEAKRGGVVNTFLGWFGFEPDPEEAFRAAMNDLMTSGAVLGRAERVVALITDAGMQAAGFTGASAFTSSQKLIFILPDRTYTTVAHELVHSTPFLWSSDQMAAACGLDYHNIGNITVAHGHRITSGGVENRARQADKLSLMGPTSTDKWIDQCTYWHMVNALQSPPDPDLVLVRGLLGRDGAETRGALLPAYQLTGVADLESGTGGDYAIVLRGRDGSALASYPFAPPWNLSVERMQGADPGLADVAQNLVSFAYRVPAVAGMDRIELTGPGGKVLDTLQYSANAPAVAITSPANGGTAPLSDRGTVHVGWTGTDADGDSLLYSVFYSPDGGETWFEQAFEQTDATLEVPVDAEDIAPTIKVVATDGARSAESVASFTLQGSSGASPGAAIAADLDPSTGGVVQNSAGTLKLEIPAGAVAAAAGGHVKVSVTAAEKAAAAGMLKGVKAPEGVRTIGRVFELRAETAGGTAIADFAKPVVFTAVLSDGDLAGVGDPGKVGLFRLGDDGALTFVGGKLEDGRLVVRLHEPGRYVPAEVMVSFRDMAGHWANGDVELMASKYVVRGLPDGRFDPGGPVTRAQFAAMLVRAMGLKPAQAPMNFRDVKAGDWYYGEAMTAVSAGIIRGYGDGTFRPNDPVTREQAAVMLARALQAAGRPAPDDSETAQVLAAFRDAGDISGWARADLALAVREGVMSGQAGALIAPHAGASRAEAAVMIARYWRKM